LSDSADNVYPAALAPMILEKPWGRAGAGPELVSGADPALKVGEIWLTADGEVSSRVENGPAAGRGLADLRRAWGVSLLGTRFAGREDRPFPLLLKFIHTATCLSIQVHPDDETAERLEGAGPGKTEAWHILGTEPDAWLILGLMAGVDHQGLHRALEHGAVESVLRRRPVRRGETYYVCAGLLHAIGPGVTLYEIQQNVDLTYRFYDWGRLDEMGRPRPLHVAKAMAALDVRPCDPVPCAGLAFEERGSRVRLLAAGRFFSLERIEVAGDWEVRLDGSRFELITIIGGRGRLAAAGLDAPLPLDPGRTLLLPAALPRAVLSAATGQPLTFLRAYVPDLEAEVMRPLLARGFTARDILPLAGYQRPNDLSAFFD
jgi:mannose-6-phosphate isomerase